MAALCSLTDNKGLFEGGACNVVPRRSAGGVDGPFVRPQQRRLGLGLARGPFLWRQRRGQRAPGDTVWEAVQGIVPTATAVKDRKTTHSNMRAAH